MIVTISIQAGMSPVRSTNVRRNALMLIGLAISPRKAGLSGSPLRFRSMAGFSMLVAVVENQLPIG